MEQLSFPSLDQQTPRPQPLSRNREAIDSIKGFRYKEDYIGEGEEDQLLRQIDEQQWLSDLKRRVQHYGFKYDYKARQVNHDMRIDHLPKWLQTLGRKLKEEGYMPTEPDQVIVNEYKPGQGIASHIDCEPCFEDTIVSLSLISDCIMDFTNKFDKTKRIPVWLAPRSIIVLNDEARYGWFHGIAPRRSDIWAGQKYERKRRISLTFRKVILK